MTAVYRLGQVTYMVARDLQKRLADERGQNLRPDSLLLLEHPHTYTLGSSGKHAHLLMTEAEQQAKGVSVYVVDRGGDITYHGPGQLVGYPILQLSNHERLRADVVAYIRQLEAMLCQAIAPFGIQGQPLQGLTGVWVEHKGEYQKIAAIGVKVTTRRVTLHGFALNVNTDLSYFAGIIPCGIPDKPVTSMATILGQSVEMTQVMRSVENAFAQTFHCQLQTDIPL